MEKVQINESKGHSKKKYSKGEGARYDLSDCYEVGVGSTCKAPGLRTSFEDENDSFSEFRIGNPAGLVLVVHASESVSYCFMIQNMIPYGY